VGDPYWAPPQQRPFLEEVSADPGRLKIGFTDRPWNGHAVDPECAAAVAGAARLCQELGHQVEEARPEWDEAARAAATLVIVGAHTRAHLELRGEALGREVQPDDVEPGVWAVAEIGRQHGAADYARAIGVVHRAGRAAGRFFTEWDALLTPTMCSPPHRLGVLSLSSRDPLAYRDALIGTIAFTAPFNWSGNPAMSVPLHWTREGLPVGVQFVGPFGGEAVLFRLAAQLERARPWAQKRPAATR
jgi:amidase